MTGEPASAPPSLPGWDPRWSRLVDVRDAGGVVRTWHVLDTGPADPVGTLLCVHGNPTWSYLWRRLAASPPPGWRVVAPDQLGMGYSERPPGPRGLADRIDDLGRLTDALGIGGPVVVVAHDWGGPVSLGWALGSRELLRGVVLMNTAVHQPSSSAPPALIRLAATPALRETVCVRTPVFVRAATALTRPPLPREVRDAYAAPYGTAGRRRFVGGFVADVPWTPEHTSSSTLEAVADGVRSLDVPVLLLWGPRDPVFGEAHLADLLDRLPDARVHRFAAASHLLPEDAPAYPTAVSAWVQDLTASPPAQPQPPAPARRPQLWSAQEARATDSAPAVVQVGGRTVSWSLLASRTAELAAGLAASGVRPGDRVALLVPPSPELTAAVYAVWRAGAVIVVADRGLGLRGMGRALRGASLDHVIGTAPGLAAARLMRLPGTRVAAGWVPQALASRLGADRSLAGLARLGRDAPPPAAPAPDDECSVLFTSGATGPAKGVVYRHRQAQAQLELVRRAYDLSNGDRIVAAFAPFALLGPALGIGSAVPETDVTKPATLSARALARAASAVEATVVFASPAALRNVAATQEELTQEDRTTLSRVRLLMSAGAPVPPALLRSLTAVLPRASMHTPYGMTEALPVTDVSLAEIDEAGAGEGVCVGRPLPGVDLAVSPLSSDGAADAPLTTEPGVTGELCVRAEHVKDHYDALWATERASSRNPGWHRTGDVGHLDDAGRLWVEGRLAHVITTTDGVVTPVGVEQRVEALPGVAAAAAVGVGPQGTQQVVLVVVQQGRPAPNLAPLADPPLADAVRAVARVPVAAVLATGRLPVDIRHASKVDRIEVARWAANVLAGAGEPVAAR